MEPDQNSDIKVNAFVNGSNIFQTVAWLPEDCDRILADACERGDLETVLGLYESGAVLHKLNIGGVADTKESIRQEFTDLIALKPKFTIEQITPTVHLDGTLATTRMRCSVDGIASDGTPVHIDFHTLEVVRKQPDGSWKYAIDDPKGSWRS